MQADRQECVHAAKRWAEWMSVVDFEAAWRESDLIESTGYPDPNRFWSGECWRGKRVMLRCLHGLGDTFSSSGMPPATKANLPLSHSAEPSRTSEIAPDCARCRRCCDLGSRRTVGRPDRSDRTSKSLPATLSSIPQAVPYLGGCSETCVSSHCKIGLVWQSSQWNPARSIPFHELAPLLEAEGCSFHFLQRDAASGGWDVLETARRMGHMDLVISVDTMSAHLAGALGKPVWIMLPAQPDWRWMRDRNDSPWYPTARLFRQKEEGNWKPVIEAVRQSLNEWNDAPPDRSHPCHRQPFLSQGVQ